MPMLAIRPLAAAAAALLLTAAGATAASDTPAAAAAAQAQPEPAAAETLPPRSTDKLRFFHSLARRMSPDEQARRTFTVAQAQPESAAAQPLPRTPRPAGALVYFITPADGETVRSPVVVRFGLKGMGVAPAGVASPNTGHHHLVVDAPTPPLDQPLPADEQHIHFGGGQTETVLALPPGRHELQLILADANHVPHDPPLVSERITITVEE